MTFCKYNKIFRLGYDENLEIFLDENADIIVQEKVDGGNAQFSIQERNDQEEIWFGSRSRYLIDGLEDGQFKANIEWVKNRIRGIELNKDYIYYGEYCKKHSLDYDWENIPLFIGFDIYSREQEKYIDYDLMVEEYKKLNLPTIPLLWKGKVKDLPKDLNSLIPISKYSKEGQDLQAEGLVLKNETNLNRWGKQLRAKIVTEVFKEENKKAFGEGPKKLTDTDKIIETYLTQTRVNKLILKLLDEEHKLERGLMKYLVTDVIKDILTEEVLNIFNQWKTIDFKYMKQKSAKIVLRYLDEFMLKRVYEKGKK